MVEPFWLQAQTAATHFTFGVLTTLEAAAQSNHISGNGFCLERCTHRCKVGHSGRPRSTLLQICDGQNISTQQRVRNLRKSSSVPTIQHKPIYKQFLLAMVDVTRSYFCTLANSRSIYESERFGWLRSLFECGNGSHR